MRRTNPNGRGEKLHLDMNELYDAEVVINVEFYCSFS